MAALDLLAKRARQVAAGLFAEVPSPCISVCRMDPNSEVCEGCFRTLDEIAEWGRMEDAGKREIWLLIAQRLALTPALSQRERE
ncbi:MAG: hypothetical protein JWQ07_3007 [Ramlibacter sp.]|nr:hypothetical protein [Ramlibacter sp.]